MRNFSIVSAVIALAALTACATAENVEGITGATGCVGCHGGKDNQTGAPPFDAHGASTTAAVGAHTAHVNASVACASCHVDPSKGPAPLHGNGTADVVFGALADPTHVATYDRSAHTCSNVYCHKPFGTAGSLPAPQWTAPAGTITGCGACHQGPGAVHGGAVAANQCVTCHASTVDGSGAIKPNGTHVNGTVDHFTHDASWATTTAPHTTPHGVAAEYHDPAYPTGFNGCRSCHGPNLNDPVVAAVPSCDSCHAGGAAWRTNCTFCHGNFGGSLQTDAAPPRDILGSAASAKVGAHQVHLFGDGANTPRISNGVTCTDCHGGTSRTLPTSFEPHADGTTEVTLKRPGQTGGSTGSFDRATGTCSNTYCHGNLLRNPQAGNTPSWTATTGQSVCGTCHAANGVYGATDVMTGTVGALGSRHEAHRCARCHGTGTGVFSTGVGCFACHVATYQQQLGATPPKVYQAIHVDGAVEVVGTTSGLYKNHNLTLTYTEPSGGNPASCTTSCHDIGAHTNAPSGAATW